MAGLWACPVSSQGRIRALISIDMPGTIEPFERSNYNRLESKYIPDVKFRYLLYIESIRIMLN